MRIQSGTLASDRIRKRLTLQRWNLFHVVSIITVQTRRAGDMTSFHPTQTTTTPARFRSCDAFGWQRTWVIDTCRLLMSGLFSRCPRGRSTRVASCLMSLLIALLVLDGGHVRSTSESHVRPHAVVQSVTVATPSHSAATGCHALMACGLAIGVTNTIPPRPMPVAALHARPAVSTATDQLGRGSDVPPPRV